MKYLVTGGSGFIGSHLCLELLKKGHKVVNLDLHAPFFESPLKPLIVTAKEAGDYQWRQLDMGCDNLEEVIDGVDGIFHLGGVLGTAETMNSVKKTAETNIVKTLNVFEAIRSTKKKAVYIAIGNDWENPYTITKVAAARFALMYNREFGTKITVVRGLNVYGGRQKWFPVNKYFPRFVMSMIDNVKIPIFGDGEQLIDVVYVGDVVEALMKAMDTDFGQEQYAEVLDAGTGHGLSVNDTVKMIFEAYMDLKGAPYEPDDWKKYVEYKPLRPGEPIRSKTLGNTAGINKILDFVPKTDLKEGIRASVQWYESYGQELAEYAKHFN